MAAKVSGTLMYGAFPEASVCSCVKQAPPSFNALGIKIWASTRSPMIGTNKVLGPISIEFVLKWSIFMEGSPHKSVPSVASKMS